MYSGNGFQTNVWGAPMWLCLHIISLNFKPELRDGYKQFFNSLQFVLPCGACRENYANIIKNILPLNDKVYKSRKSLAKWLFLVHNQVQKDIYIKSKKENDKPKYSDSNEDFKKAMEFYEGFRAKCIKDQYGCIKPLKGFRKRTKIDIVKFVKPRIRNAIVNI
uniref:thiol oxidase n=1 Tax=viral metagenome TaxID=1070528 RepID=A0A6C0F6Q3_9ZZZZ|tara:strand:- start:3549 stop:4037 length:489 start_codon:yes stop_codon:yes gene_type:complete